MPKKILVTGTSLVPPSIREYIQSEGFQVVYDPKDNWTPDELDLALQGVHGYMIGGYEEPTAENFEKADNLEVVGWIGTDYQAYIPGWKKAFDIGIAIVNSPGANVNAVAEYTISLILILLRRINDRLESLDSKDSLPTGGELLGKTLGIIGMGRIGSRVSQIAKQGFGMNVVYSSRSRNQALENDLEIKYMEKNELLSTSDVISLHRPGLAEGESAEIGPKELSLIKKDSVLINTVKWNLIDLVSLYDALTQGNLRAVAFDGYGEGTEWEKLINLGWNKVVRFPQSGYNTNEANYRASMITAQAIINVLRGESSPYINNSDFKTKRKK